MSWLRERLLSQSLVEYNSQGRDPNYLSGESLGLIHELFLIMSVLIIFEMLNWAANGFIKMQHLIVEAILISSGPYS